MIPSKSIMLRRLRLEFMAARSRLFPAGSPEGFWERLEKEIQLMCDTGKTEEVYVFSELAKAAKRAGAPFDLRGRGNASLFAFLLTDSAVDPLPAHRYCPACGHDEAIPDVPFGLDAAEKVCPCCGKKMRSGGFSLPLEIAWPEGKGAGFTEFSTALSVSAIFTELQRLYGKRVARMSEQVADEPDGSVTYILGKPKQEGTRFVLDGLSARFAIFPGGHSLSDYPELKVRCGNLTAVYAPLEELEERGIRHLSFVRWRGFPLGGNGRMTLRGIRPMPELIDSLKAKIALPDLLAPNEALQWRNTAAWRKMQAAPPSSYYELTEILCLAHSGWMERPVSLKDTAFASRESLFRLLRRNGLSEQAASKVAEFIRMGGASDPKRREEWLSLLDQYPALEAVRKDAENCRYLWPQAALLPAVMDAIACAGRKTI